MSFPNFYPYQAVTLDSTSDNLVPDNQGYLYNINGTYKINLETGLRESFTYTGGSIALVVSGSAVSSFHSNGIRLTNLSTNYSTTTIAGAVGLTSEDYESRFVAYNDTSRSLIKTQTNSKFYDLYNVDTLDYSHVSTPWLNSILPTSSYEYLRAVCSKQNSSNFLAIGASGISGFSTISKLVEFQPDGTYVRHKYIQLDWALVTKFFTVNNLVVIIAPPIMNVYDSTSFELVDSHIIPNNLTPQAICFAQNNHIMLAGGTDQEILASSTHIAFSKGSLFTALVTASGCQFDNFTLPNTLMNIDATHFVKFIGAPARLGIDQSTNKSWFYNGNALILIDLYPKSNSTVIANSQNPVHNDVQARVLKINDTSRPMVFFDRNLDSGDISTDSLENSSIIELSLYSTNQYDLRKYDD